MAVDPSADEIEKFEALKPRLCKVWEALESDPAYEHTSVVPSLSIDIGVESDRYLQESRYVLP